MFVYSNYYSFTYLKKGKYIKANSKNLIFGAFVAGLFAGVLYWLDLGSQKEIPTEKQIAIVKTFSNDARIKAIQQITWRPIKLNAPLGVGDSLFTGKNSKIEIEFKDKNELIMNSNTLVRLKFDEKQLKSVSNDKTEKKSFELDLSYGQLELKSNKPTEWKIRHQDEYLELKSGPNACSQIEIKKNNSFQVVAKNGDLSVLHNGKVKEIKPQSPPEIFISLNALMELKDIANKEQFKQAKNNESDAPATIVHITDDNGNLIADVSSAQKNTQTQMDKTDELKEEKDPKENEIKQSRSIKSNDKKLKQAQPIIKATKSILPDVKEKKQTSSTEMQNQTAPSSKEITEDEKNEILVDKLNTNSRYAAPSTRAPFHESTIYFQKKSKLNVHFIWGAGPKEAKSYILQIATNDLFKPVLITRIVPLNKIDIELPKTGKFFWKVKNSFGNDASPWSETKTFIVDISE